MCRIWALQLFDLPTLRAHSIDFYEQIMRKYLRDRKLIPPGNLAETCYEDLVREPLGTMQQLYDGLGLNGFNEALPAFREQVERDVGSLAGDIDKLSGADREKIRNRLEFAFSALGYDPDKGFVSHLRTKVPA